MGLADELGRTLPSECVCVCLLACQVFGMPTGKRLTATNNLLEDAHSCGFGYVSAGVSRNGLNAAAITGRSPASDNDDALKRAEPMA